MQIVFKRVVGGPVDQSPSTPLANKFVDSGSTQERGISFYPEAARDVPVIDINQSNNFDFAGHNAA